MRTSALIIVVLAGLAAAGFFMLSDRSGGLIDEENEALSPTEYFLDEMQARVVEALGQPIEGFEPAMFMAVFPELMADDFDGVETQQGRYQESSGELAFVLTTSEPEHSAARAIIDIGMETLLNNVSKRLSISPTTNEGVDTLIDMISGVNVPEDIVGTWRSIDDPKFTREFHENGGVVDRHEGDENTTTVGEWNVFTDPARVPADIPDIEEATYLAIVFGGDTEPLYFTVSELASSTLELIFLNRGGALRFERVRESRGEATQ